jgi:hypothetical protein
MLSHRLIAASTLSFALLGLASANAASFTCDWSKAISTCWKYPQVMSSDRFKVVTTPVRHGKYSAQITVKSGDDPINSSGERSEYAYMMQNGTAVSETLSSGTKYYAISVMLASNWQPPATESGNGNWGILFQLHGPDSYSASPAFALRATTCFDIALNGGDLTFTKGVPTTYKLSSGGLNKGQWVDFVVGVKWAQDTTGSVTVWRRDQSATGFTTVLNLSNVATLQYKNSTTAAAHYWKTGFYRSTSSFTNKLWLGPMSRADTFQDAVTTAWGG